MAQAKQSTPLELPSGSVAYSRAVLRASQVSLYHADQALIELPAHTHIQGQISFLLEPAFCLMHWADRRGQWHEKTLHGPHDYVVAPGRAHASKWEKAAGLLEIYYEPEAFWRMFPKKTQGLYFADATSVRIPSPSRISRRISEAISSCNATPLI